ncbi:hypothetical protein CYMTET_23450, partial [Cymbomonas tetramitiformis]
RGSKRVSKKDSQKKESKSQVHLPGPPQPKLNRSWGISEKPPRTLGDDDQPKLAGQTKAERSGFLRFQLEAQAFYSHGYTQIAIALLIFANFVVNAAEAQAEGAEETFLVLEYIFTILFTAELLLNMYCGWLWTFWRSTWNVFDFVVVAVSLLSLVVSGLPGVGILRLMRAFRVFRLFKRMQSLYKIILCLQQAVPGCLNASSIVVLVTAIYSILAVEFFRYDSPEYFGTFFAAMFSLFQMLTGDAWAEAYARDLIAQYPSAGFFFCSYYIVGNIILFNVVIAVLLDRFVQPDEAMDDDEDFVDFADAEMSIPGVTSQPAGVAGTIDAAKAHQEKTGQSFKSNAFRNAAMLLVEANRDLEEQRKAEERRKKELAGRFGGKWIRKAQQAKASPTRPKVLAHVLPHYVKTLLSDRPKEYYKLHDNIVLEKIARQMHALEVTMSSFREDFTAFKLVRAQCTFRRRGTSHIDKSLHCVSASPEPHEPLKPQPTLHTSTTLDLAVEDVKWLARDPSPSDLNAMGDLGRNALPNSTGQGAGKGASAEPLCTAVTTVYSKIDPQSRFVLGVDGVPLIKQKAPLSDIDSPWTLNSLSHGKKLERSDDSAQQRLPLGPEDTFDPVCP